MEQGAFSGVTCEVTEVLRCGNPCRGCSHCIHTGQKFALCSECELSSTWGSQNLEKSHWWLSLRLSTLSAFQMIPKTLWTNTLMIKFSFVTFSESVTCLNFFFFFVKVFINHVLPPFRLFIFICGQSLLSFQITFCFKACNTCIIQVNDSSVVWV